MGAAIFSRDHDHIEAVRLDHRTIAAQIIIFGGETVSVGFPIEPLERHGQRNFAGRDRFSVAVGVNAEFRRDAIFEDGHLDREISVAQYASVVGAALIVPFGRLAFNSCFGGVFAAARGQRQGDAKRRGKRDFGHFHWIGSRAKLRKRPVSRSSSERAR